jgi:hypothetical protein
MFVVEKIALEAAQSVTVPAARKSARYGPVLFGALAAALAVAAYANALGGPFVYDDFREVLDNPSIGDLRDLRAILLHYPTRPFTNLSYAIDFARGGLDPFTYHVTNVLLHVTNVVLLFVIARQLAGDGRLPQQTSPAAATFVAFTAAGLFAVHPLLTEAVTFISGRSDVLAATLFLCSFYCFRRAFIGGRRTFLIAGVGLLFLAVGAKETAVMLPPVLLAYDVLLASRVDGGWRTRFARFYAPLGAIILMIGGARMWWHLTAEAPADAGVQWSHLLLELHVLELYVSKLLLPVSQSIVPSVGWIETVFDPRLIWTAAVLGLTTAIAIVNRKREPLITFGVAWFVLALLPSAILVVIADRAAPMAEHRVYLASGGFFLAVAAAISRAVHVSPRPRLRRAAVVYACLAAVFGVLISLTVARNRLWADPILLWEDAAKKAPSVPRSHMELGHTYLRFDEPASAAAAYKQAIALRPDAVIGYLGLAFSLRALAQHGEARVVLRTAVARMPEETRPMMALAHLEAGRFNNPGEALRLCRQVLAITPADQDAAACAARYEPRVLGGSR